MPRLGKRGRRTLLFAHVAVSVGWLGAGLTMTVLGIAGLRARADPWPRAAYAAMQLLDLAVMAPCAFASLLSGLLLSWLTPWGFARHWWVLAKLVLNVAVIVFSFFGVGVWVEASLAATDAGAASPVGGRLFAGGIANLSAMLTMTWLSIFKPFGTTPWTTRGNRPPQPLSSAARPDANAQTSR